MSSLLFTGTKSFWSILLVVFLRYLILAAIAFVFFYVLRKDAWRFKRIQQKFPSSTDYWREIAYSISTAFIFAWIGYLVFATPLVKYTQVYLKISEFGVGYFLFSIVLMIIVHDTYFYWTHWLMHKKQFYRIVHKVHHLSTNPSPWAAMAFHPIESVISACVVVLIVFLFPVHPLALGIFLLFMMVYNVYGHLGYELYPKGFSKNAVGKWINTSVNHNLHHQTFTGNYGLYFLFWDRLMGTVQENYDHKFEEVKSRHRPAENVLASEKPPR